MQLQFNKIKRIIHHLMLNAYFIPDISFSHGQMGVALTMSEYSRYTNNEIYFDVASYLLDNIVEKIAKNLNYSFSTGLSGIGWGIEYLIQNSFIEGKSLEICEEIDRKIMETDPKRIEDLSLNTGFEGLLHYVIYHLQGTINQNAVFPFDTRYLSDLYDKCILLKKQTKDKAINFLLDIFINFHATGAIQGYNVSIIDFVTIESTDLSERITSYPLDLKEGLSGKLLKIIIEK
mgnify:CR=1 FL=1